MEVKPGYLTSEFWMALVNKAITLAVFFGVVSSTDARELEGAAAQIVTGVFAIAAGAWTWWKYIRERMTIKTEALRMQLTVPRNFTDPAPRVHSAPPEMIEKWRREIEEASRK